MDLFPGSSKLGMLFGFALLVIGIIQGDLVMQVAGLLAAMATFWAFVIRRLLILNRRISHPAE
ncbi:MAG: hypothetical protein AAF493_00775 [Pseudomonadota bacterium]